jgi:hypothetical protein
LATFGWCDINRNDPIRVALPKVAKASTVQQHPQSLLPAVSLTNVANVNYPRGVYTGEKTLHIVAVTSDGDLKKM